MPGLDQTVVTLVDLFKGHPNAAIDFTDKDWGQVIATAKRQHLAPLLYTQLKQLGIKLPLNSATQLREIYFNSTKRSTRLFHEMGKILRELQSKNIPVIPLKGACLAEIVYGNIDVRPLGDVDLLVKLDDLTQTLSILQKLGYSSKQPFDFATEQKFCQHMPPLYGRTGLMVEIHWTIVNPRENVRFDKADLEQLWARAISVTIAGEKTLMLSPTDLLLNLCIHVSVHHCFDITGLRDFIDMAKVIQRYNSTIDWEQFITLANQWGISKEVRLVLQVTQECTNVTIPCSVLATLQAPPFDKEIVARAKQKSIDRSSRSIKLDLERFKKIDTIRFEGKTRLVDKLGVLREVLFPSREVMSSIYHVPANSWRIMAYYPVRIKDFLKRYQKMLWHVVRGDRDYFSRENQEMRLREYLDRR